MRYWKILCVVVLALILSSCATKTNNIQNGEDKPVTKRVEVNKTPTVAHDDLYGIWTGGETTDAGHIGYLYISADGVYWMGSKVGKPSASDFTSEYKIASNYSVSVDGLGATVCKFGKYTATVSSKSSINVSGLGSFKK